MIQVTFVNERTGVMKEHPNTIEHLTLTFEHVWDKSGQEPVLVAVFSSDQDRWVESTTGDLFTDIYLDGA